MAYPCIATVPNPAAPFPWPIEKDEAFISECYSLNEAFALSLKPAKASDQIKARLMEMVKNRQAH